LDLSLIRVVEDAVYFLFVQIWQLDRVVFLLGHDAVLNDSIIHVQTVFHHLSLLVDELFGLERQVLEELVGSANLF
jgi:hypothetical protein